MHGGLRMRRDLVENNLKLARAEAKSQLLEWARRKITDFSVENDSDTIFVACNLIVLFSSDTEERIFANDLMARLFGDGV
jgi:hypothetical protein